jgi:hypothetical protein
MRDASNVDCGCAPEEGKEGKEGKAGKEGKGVPCAPG